MLLLVAAKMDRTVGTSVLVRDGGTSYVAEDDLNVS